MKKKIEETGKLKRMHQMIREEIINKNTTLNSGLAMGSTSNGATQRVNRGPMDRFLEIVEDDVEEINDIGGSEKKRLTAKELRDEVCMEIGRCFFNNVISFNVVDSPSFVSMCQTIGQYGIGLKPPSSYELKTNILKKEEENTKKMVHDVKKTWEQTEVSILSDRWKDRRRRQLINILVNNPYDSVFLRSIDVGDYVKNATLIFKLLNDVVEEIGENLVVQVVTDNASRLKLQKSWRNVNEKEKTVMVDAMCRTLCRFDS